MSADILTIVQSMRAAGLNDTQIIAVIEEHGKIERERKALLREKDRLRKRAERANIVIDQQSCPECPVDTSDNSDTPLQGSNGFSNSSLTPINPKRKETLKGVSKRKVGELDGFEAFWEQFPRQRRGSKENAAFAYFRALDRSPASEIMAGVMRYGTSEEVSRGFAKGAAAWLNDDRWTCDYSKNTGQADGKSNHNPNETRSAFAAGLAQFAAQE